MANRLGGIATLLINGTAYPLVGKLMYSPGNKTRTTEDGQDDVHGYSEKPRANFISATIRDAFGMSVASFNDMVGANLTAELANGKLVTGTDMWTVDAQEVDTETATFELRFEGLTGSVTEN